MRRRGRYRRYRVGRVIAVMLVAGALVWGGAHAGAALIVRQRLPSADALVVLGSHEWERLPVAARLAAARPHAVVLLTEPRQASASNCHLCGERVAWLEALGIPATRIEVLPRRVTNTLDEAIAAREYSESHAVRQLLVVTSPYHARRALAVFRTAFKGMDVRIGVNFDESVAVPEQWWRYPYDRAYVAYEWAAVVWYAMRHGVSPLAADSLLRNGTSAL